MQGYLGLKYIENETSFSSDSHGLITETPNYQKAMDDPDHTSPQDESSSVESLPPLTLTETPATMSPPTQSDSTMPPSSLESTWQLGSLSSADDELTDKMYHDMHKSAVLHSLNPYKSALTPGDVESCLALEQACFGGDLAASREKVSSECRASSQVLLLIFTFGAN
jgi:hypothetical protein